MRHHAQLIKIFLRRKKKQRQRDQAQGNIAGNVQTGFRLWPLNPETAMACLVASTIPFGSLSLSLSGFFLLLRTWARTELGKWSLDES